MPLTGEQEEAVVSLLWDSMTRVAALTAIGRQDSYEGRAASGEAQGILMTLTQLGYMPQVREVFHARTGITIPEVPNGG